MTSAKQSGLCIRGKNYTNSAAKFWVRFLRERRAAFPAATVFELSAPGVGVLDRRVLDPAETLAAEWERLDAAGARRAYAATVEELELLGPPAGVRLRVLQGEEVIADQAMEAIDAETFPYLLGWLMEWGKVEEMLWSQAYVSGGFEAEDLVNGERSRVAFAVATEELGEGMVMRTVTVRAMWHRRPACV